MPERILDMIKRFPEDEKLIRELVHSDTGFDALCQEYRDSAEELSRLESSGSSAGSKENWLKWRCCCLEEEILAKIEGYRPV
jgi:hypothetical protein